MKETISQVITGIVVCMILLFPIITTAALVAAVKWIIYNMYPSLKEPDKSS